MRWTTAALLLLAGLLAACSSEGGSRGSGISTLIRGNVASIQTADLRAPLMPPQPAADASTPLVGIQVVVNGTDLHGETDASGNFTVQGDFDGTFNLLFQRSADGLNASMPVTVPAGGALTLVNVAIDHAVATAETQQADFDAIIVTVDCTGPSITMKSVQQSPTDPDQYEMDLTNSTLQDSHGNTLACTALRSGQEVMVHQAEATNGVFGGGIVQVVD